MKIELAYLLSEFPNVSETFILNEVFSIKKYNDINLTIYSFHKPNFESYDSQTLSKIKNIRIIYLPIHRLFLNNLLFFLSEPLKYLKYFFNSLNLLFDMKSFFAYFVSAGWYKDLKDNKTQHVHSHFANYATLFSYNIHKLLNIPYSFTSHANDIFKINTKKNLKILTNNSKFHATISKYNRKFLSRIDGIDSSKINIIHCGIQTQKFKPINYKLKDPLEILSVCRLVEKKGLKYLIDAMDILNREGFNFNLNIIGDGPEKEKLQNQILEKNLSKKVFLLGLKGNAFVKKKLSESSLFVLPCVIDSRGDMDGIPVALMESMALGIPVISTNVSGIPELINNKKDGLLIEEKNFKALAKSIKIFLKLNVNQLRKNARDKIMKEFNISHEVNKLHNLFKSHGVSNPK